MFITEPLYNFYDIKLNFEVMPHIRLTNYPKYDDNLFISAEGLKLEYKIKVTVTYK